MFEFVTRWLVCLVLLAVVVQSERTIKDMADRLFEKRQAMLVWLFVNMCLAVCTAVVMGWM
jgi:Mg/Co/Ni transporter MgtE